jgi:hypothetical protein
MSRFDVNRVTPLSLRVKCLILNKFFLLIFEATCSGARKFAGSARVAASYPQSFPQIVWMGLGRLPAGFPEELRGSPNAADGASGNEPARPAPRRRRGPAAAAP